MKRQIVLLVLMCLILAPMHTFAQEDIRVAVARVQDANGQFVGTVTFTQVNANVVVVAQVTGLPPGLHGLHVHMTGLCDTSTEKPFSSAGSHLNPSEATHGNHAGDLPALLVLGNGTGYLTTFTDRFAVSDLIDTDGSAVIIHDNADNYANIPERYGAPDEETLGTGDAGARIGCGIVQSAATAWDASDTIAAFQTLPLDQVPAAVHREEKAERGSLIMTLDSLGGMQLMTQIISGAGGQIGTMTMEGDNLIFTFTDISYEVGVIHLPGGVVIAPQAITLDPAQPSTMQVNLTTGEVSRNLHWIMTSTEAIYDGQNSVALGDTANAQIVEIQDIGNNQFTVRLITHWKTSLELANWSVNGTSLPAGQITAQAEFDGKYLIDFNQ